MILYLGLVLLIDSVNGRLLWNNSITLQESSEIAYNMLYWQKPNKNLSDPILLINIQANIDIFDPCQPSR